MTFDVRAIFKALNEAGVDYVVVGGLAVILHGYLRATADIDLVIGLDRANGERAVQALEGAGLKPRLPLPLADLAREDARREWGEHRNMLVFPLWDPGNPMRSVDVFVREPMPFVELARDAVVKKIDGMDVRVASIEHLIAMKRISSRARDLEDIEKLTAIQAMENKDESQ